MTTVKARPTLPFLLIGLYFMLLVACLRILAADVRLLAPTDALRASRPPLSVQAWQQIRRYQPGLWKASLLFCQEHLDLPACAPVLHLNLCALQPPHGH